MDLGDNSNYVGLVTMPEVERSAKKAAEARGRGGSRASYRLPFGSFEAGAAMEDFPELGVKFMQITLDLPDDVARSLEANLPRVLLESLALEGYGSGKLSDEQVRKILGYGTRMQVDGFLKEHGVYLDYTLEDLDRETETSREFSSR